MAIALKSQQITNLIDRLRYVFPKQMQALQDTKECFEATYTAYEEALRCGDVQKAERLRTVLQESQTALEQAAYTFGLAIATYLETEKGVV